MPLESVPLPRCGRAVPADVRRFLRAANRRIASFCREYRLPRFVPSDFPGVYCGLRALDEAGLAPGRGFCEWGSGFGVVACLAAWLDFDACGIEIEASLVEAARELADDFDLPVELVRGSYVADGETGGSSYAELGRPLGDFDIVFAYPWPDEQWEVAEQFERHARTGALLLTGHPGEDLVARRKTGAAGGEC